MSPELQADELSSRSSCHLSGAVSDVWDQAARTPQCRPGPDRACHRGKSRSDPMAGRSTPSRPSGWAWLPGIHLDHLDQHFIQARNRQVGSKGEWKDDLLVVPGCLCHQPPLSNRCSASRGKCDLGAQGVTTERRDIPPRTTCQTVHAGLPGGCYERPPSAHGW